MRALALLTLLAGCAAPPEMTRPQDVAFIGEAGGLAVAGSAMRIDFGRSPGGVIAALDRELGRGRVLGTESCPEGIQSRMSWDGLELTFTRERFVGWMQAGASAGQVCSSPS